MDRPGGREESEARPYVSPHVNVLVLVNVPETQATIFGHVHVYKHAPGIRPNASGSEAKPTRREKGEV
jgi:hypothetical protein